MNQARALLGWLDDRSDWLSPLVVKEVRQVVRGREFTLAFASSLTAGLLVAAGGAADVLTGSSTSGVWTFAALMACLAFLGLVVVPLGAFNALRTERMEQTLELITLTSLSPRRIVIGKLLAQAVKLVTLFSAMAPFVTMSFLLGGVDILTILVALLIVFLISLWIAALCLFLSTSRSRMMALAVFGAGAALLFFTVVIGRGLFLAMGRGAPIGVFGTSATGTGSWWFWALAASVWLMTLINLVLLAENRLALQTEDRVTPLRIGFFAQFLLIIGWTLSCLVDSPSVRSQAMWALMVAGSLHLAVVATFTLTEDLSVPRRVLNMMTTPSRWRWWLATFGTGGGRAARYVLAQMLILLVATTLFGPLPEDRRWVLAACGYICFFTGVPVMLFHLVAPSRVTAVRLRVAILVMLAAIMLMPDIVYYLVVRPEVLDVKFAPRHLIDPIRTLTNWDSVDAGRAFLVPVVMGLIGLAALAALMVRGGRVAAQQRVDGETVRGPAAD